MRPFFNFFVQETKHDLLCFKHSLIYVDVELLPLRYIANKYCEYFSWTESYLYQPPCVNILLHKPQKKPQISFFLYTMYFF